MPPLHDIGFAFTHAGIASGDCVSDFPVLFAFFWGGQHLHIQCTPSNKSFVESSRCLMCFVDLSSLSAISRYWELQPLALPKKPDVGLSIHDGGCSECRLWNGAVGYATKLLFFLPNVLSIVKKKKKNPSIKLSEPLLETVVYTSVVCGFPTLMPPNLLSPFTITIVTPTMLTP